MMTRYWRQIYLSVLGMVGKAHLQRETWADRLSGIRFMYLLSELFTQKPDVSLLVKLLGFPSKSMTFKLSLPRMSDLFGILDTVSLL